MLAASARTRIAADLNISPEALAAIEEHLAAGDPIPYIARRFPVEIGGLDVAALRRARARIEEAKELESRRANLLQSLGEGEAVKKLREVASAATDRYALDDVAAHQRKHKGTRGSEAIAKGLEPLADAILQGTLDGKTPEEGAAAFVGEEKGVASAQDALHGAVAILAERLSAEPEVRARVRREMRERGEIVSKVFDATKTGADRYKEFFELRERGKSMSGRRYLKLRQGEREKVLKFSVELHAEAILPELEGKVLPAVPENPPDSQQNGADKARHELLKSALRDAVAHILPGAIELEVRTEWKERSDLETINFLRKNVRSHCMRAPYGRRVVMGFDPLVRKGLRAAVIGADGGLLAEATFATDGEGRGAALDAARALVRAHKVEAIALANEAASEVAFRFLKDAFAGVTAPAPVAAAAVAAAAPGEAPAEAIAESPSVANANETANSEAAAASSTTVIEDDTTPWPEIVRVPAVGAAAIANSPAAREEFGDQPVPVRAAVSMGRRLQDPIAELARVEPKVLAGFHHGQDVAKGRLERMLQEEVESCIHEVPIDLNTAPAALLSWVGAMGAENAKKIVQFRKEQGRFASRVGLARVGLDEKTFERSVAFLRVAESAEPLDSTGVHPQHSAVVEKLVKAAGAGSPGELTMDALAALPLETLADEAISVALLRHVRDLLGDHGKSGKGDPRGEFVRTIYNEGVRTLGQMKPGQELQGIVRGIANFGVFVDVGVSQDGLLHVSELASHFVKDPSEIVKVGDVVKVRVLSVEAHKKKIALTMRTEEERQQAEQRKAEERNARREQRNAARERAKERKIRQAEYEARKAQGLAAGPGSGPQYSGQQYSAGPRPSREGFASRPAPPPVRAATTRRDGVTGGKKRRGGPSDRGRRDGRDSRGRGREEGDFLPMEPSTGEKSKPEAPPPPANPFKRFFQSHGLLEG